MNILLIPLMAALYRWAGGGLWAEKLDRYKITWIPEALFCIVITACIWPAYDYWAILCGAWSYGWLQSATAPFLHWGRGGYNPDRRSTLSPLVDWIAGKFGWDNSTIQYCRLYCGIKGTLVALPLLWLAPLNGVLWVLAYEYGHVKGANWREILAGAGTGLCLVLWLF